jgi:hypothetical protein
MNAYSLPGHELQYYRMAHEHRLTLNVLPYHWQGSRLDAGPVIRADGSWDWAAWDVQYGPLFDGSAFADLPRAGVPIEAFYLMLNEGWPMDHDAHFKGGYWIEDAYDAGYWEKFREGAGRIAQHLAEKKWSETMFEFYLNNKVSFKTGGWRRTTAAWILDEPSNTQDFWALRWYGLEFWRAVAEHAGPRLVYRGDISRPQWQRDLFDGVMNVEVMSGALRTYTEMVRERAERHGQMYYMYGSANPLGTSAAGNAAWCVEAWAMGADGVIPWQTIGKKDAWQVPDDLAVFYPREEGPAASLRMKSFRAGQQLVEYLTMYAAASGQSREAVGLAVLDGYDLRARTVKKNEDDAGKSAFSERGLDGLRELRWRLGCWLDQKKPEAKPRWYDPRPPRCEVSGVRNIQAIRP